MKTWWNVLLVTVIVGVAAYLLAGTIWPPAPGARLPSAAEMPWYTLWQAIVSLAFGLAISFLIFGFPLVQQAVQRPRWLVWLSFLSIVWLLGMWWIRDNWLLYSANNPPMVLFITIGFQLDVLFAGAILAYGFSRVVQECGVRPAEQGCPEPGQQPC
jgi:hypothetical protein